MTPFDPSTFHPQPDRILAYLIKKPSTYGRIILPLESVQDTNLARIVAVGSNLDPSWVGQAALITQTGGTLIHSSPERTYLSYHKDELLALIEDAPETPAPEEAPNAP